MPLLRVVALLIAASSVFAQTINIFAGGGTGDNRAATASYLNQPAGLVLRQGNLIIVDQFDNRIRQVNTTTQIITTLAGTGMAGYVDGPAASAQFNLPNMIRADAQGRLFLSDVGNRRIRMIAADGTVSTIAGAGTQGDSGDGGPATAAQFIFPYGLAVDANGNVFVSDSSAHRVRRINTSGTITTVAGTGAPGFSGDGGAGNVAALSAPLGMAADATGVLYIADSDNGRIRRLGVDGTISTFAGCAPPSVAPFPECPAISLQNPPPALATTRRLANPQDVAVAADGSVFILDAVNTNQGLVAAIWRVDANRQISMVTAVGGRSPSFAVDSIGTIYVPELFRRVVFRIQGGVATTFAGGSVLDGEQGPAAGLILPAGVAVDNFGNAIISDSGNNRIRRVDLATGVVSTIAGNGVPTLFGDNGPAVNASLNFPTRVAFDADNNMYVADTSNHRIRKVAPNGTITTFAGSTGGSCTATGCPGDDGPATSARLAFPLAVAVHPISGDVFIADTANRRIRRVGKSDGVIRTYAGSGNPGQATLCSAASASVSCGDGGQAASATFSQPYDLAFDAQGNLYVADFGLPLTGDQVIGGFRVRKIDGATGVISTVAGNGQITADGDGNPPIAAAVGMVSGITVDRNTGTIFIADNRNHRIRRVSGTISKLAGTTRGFSGDGGPAVDAMLSMRGSISGTTLTPGGGLAIDRAGNLLVADTGNNRVRRITGVTNPTPRQLVVKSGNSQQAPVGGVILQDLVVSVLDGGTPVEGVNVQFAATPAGAATLNPASVTTNNAGEAATKVTLGTIPGTVTITASSPGLPSVNFEVKALPVLNPGGAVNGASFQVGSAPGAIMSLFGVGMTTATEQAGSLPLPTNLGGAFLRVQGATGAPRLAPLFYVSPNQVNFQMPFEVSGPTVSLTMGAGGVESASLDVALTAEAPGLFTRNQSGSGPGVLLHADYSPVTESTPARTGEVLLIYCTGLGPVDPQIPSGVAAPGDPLSRVTSPVEVTIGGIVASVDFAGLAPGFAGLYQINARVPAAVTPGGAVTVSVKVGTRTGNAVTIPVQ